MGLPKNPSLAIAPERMKTEENARVAFGQGDVQAFECLCTPHLDLLYTLALRITGNPSIAEDVAQETLVRALSRCHQYDPKRPFRPWLLRIATNLSRDRIRTVWWKRIAGLNSDIVSSVPSAEVVIDATERDRRVRQALLALPIKYREALSLYHLEDISYAEMSEVTGASVSALKQRVRRGQLMLRQKLEKLYPDEFVSRSEG
jgi:RNA polymerase sigma-70 factor (ECF subfamily)